MNNEIAFAQAELNRVNQNEVKRLENWENGTINDGGMGDESHLGLSAWAAGINQRLYSTRLEIAKNGGMHEFRAVLDIETGEEIPTKLIKGKFGLCRAFLNSEKKFTGRFISLEPELEDWVTYEYKPEHLTEKEWETIKNKEIKKHEKKLAKWQEKNQVKMGMVMAPAFAMIKGNGYGLAGITSCYVAIIRKSEATEEETEEATK